MHTYIYLPPLKNASGGLAVLTRLGALLNKAGYQVSFVVREEADWLGGLPGALAPDVPLVWWRDGDPRLGRRLAADDIWLIPEGWPHAMTPALRQQARLMIYVQNWAYFLSQWPQNLAPTALHAEYLAVSRPVAWYVRKITGKQPSILRPGIDLSVFRPGADFALAAGRDRSPRIAWMPRKNKNLARHIMEIVDAGRANRPRVEWVEIANKSQAEVAAILAGCDLFLATGFPEGFALPPLEAMACGCVGLGFSGFGGWDYMRFADAPPDVPPGVSAGAPWPPGALPSWLPDKLREDSEPRPGNGIWASDGDIIGAALAVEKALHLREENGPVWAELQHGALATAVLYDLDSMAKDVAVLWQKFASNFIK